ncbi:potassium channel family protein [Streptomyces fuscigenes]|uniref:potassium channel family protein n=1 Tax=Streptomyces fuscigenes TaxID=1528880 RepID=UPI001F1E6978|nr:potassium channel family protein [Streptomyces fuscigenes]MCF3961322.1 potassium channel family protein [Streptomyces fuscigenes]
MQPSFLAVLIRWMSASRRKGTHVRASLWALAVTLAVVLVGSWLVVPAEHGAPQATITSYPRALWWSLETATTVGYGDMYPVTLWGRIIACVVMLVGISLFGILTAALATWFVGGAAKDLRKAGEALRHLGHDGRVEASADVEALHRRFDRLEQLVKEGRGPRG